MPPRAGCARLSLQGMWAADVSRPIGQLTCIKRPIHTFIVMTRSVGSRPSFTHCCSVSRLSGLQEWPQQHKSLSKTPAISAGGQGWQAIAAACRAWRPAARKPFHLNSCIPACTPAATRRLQHASQHRRTGTAEGKLPATSVRAGAEAAHQPPARQAANSSRCCCCTHRYQRPWGLWKPRRGTRSRSGVWPPSNPSRGLRPVG